MTKIHQSQVLNLETDLASKNSKVFYTVGFSDADYICDGTNDDVQINQAINAVNTAGGGTVYVKSGTYDIATATLKVKSNVQFCGEGNTTILKRNNTGSLVGVFTPSGSGSISNFSLKNFKVDCNETTVVANHFGITIGFSGLPAEYFKVENITITKSSKGALQLSNCHYFEVCGITQDSADQIATADAIDLNLNCHHFDIHDVKMKSGDDGVVCAQSWYGTINNIQNEGSATGGAVRISGQATASHDITVTNIFALNCNNAFIVSNVGTFSQQCYNITASNIIGVGCDRAVAINCSNFMQDGITLPFRNVVISNVVAKGCNYGLHIDSRYCVDGLVINNFISQGALVYGMLIQSAFNMQLSNIDISDSVDSGIRVNIINGVGYLKNLSIKNATLRNNGGRGLHVSPTTFFDDNANMYIEDIKTMGNTLSGIEVSGAHFYMKNITSTGNSQMGIRFNAASGYGSSYVTNSYLSGNLYGLYFGSGAESYVNVFNTSLTGNSTGTYNLQPVSVFPTDIVSGTDVRAKDTTGLRIGDKNGVNALFIANGGALTLNPQVSLAANSSFEIFAGSADTNTTNAISSWTSVPDDGYINSSTLNVTDGSYSVKIYRGTNSNNFRQDVTLTASTQYAVSFDGTSDATGGLWFKIIYDDGTVHYLTTTGTWSTTDQQALSVEIADTTPTAKSLTFTTPAFAGSYRLAFNSVALNSATYIDNFKIVPTAANRTVGVANKTYTFQGNSGTIALVGDIQPKTATYTALVTDRTILMDATTGALTVNLPTAASSTNQILTIKKVDSSANTVTIDGNGSETIDGTTTKILATQWEKLTIQSNGTAWFVI